MKIHTSLNKNFKKKKELVSATGDIKFNNKKTHINSKGVKKSSQKWLNRQLSDPFVSAAKIDGYLARSAYKLLEIQKKYNILAQDYAVIIDLGCSPGSWSQVITTDAKMRKTQIIGIDILQPKFIHNHFHFIQGDFEQENTQQKIITAIKNLRNNMPTAKNARRNTLDRHDVAEADCIICDIAPNNIGNSEIDRIRSERIIDEVLIFSKTNLCKGGNLVCKAIKGADQITFPTFKNMFEKVFRFKPKSSRKDSSEIFLIGINKK